MMDSTKSHSAEQPAGARDAELHEQIIAALRTVHDPEIPVNVYDLGLIYDIALLPEGDESGAKSETPMNAESPAPASAGITAAVRMTLTAPNCPVADSIVANVARAVRGVEGIADAQVTLVWEPAWHTDMMSEIAQIELEAMGIDPRRPKPPGSGGGASLTIGRRPVDR